MAKVFPLSEKMGGNGGCLLKRGYSRGSRVGLDGRLEGTGTRSRTLNRHTQGPGHHVPDVSSGEYLGTEIVAAGSTIAIGVTQIRANRIRPACTGQVRTREVGEAQTGVRRFKVGILNRPGFPGGSKPWKGWSHGTRAPRIEAVPA